MLIEQVRTHLDTENSVLLTAVEDLIDDDTLLELGRRMEQRDQVIEARRELATVVPGGPRGRRIAAALGGLAALGTAVLAILARRRRRPLPPPPADAASAADPAASASRAPTLRPGGVAERPKAATLKVAGPERAPWVRIPPPPPCSCAALRRQRFHWWLAPLKG